MFPEMKPCFITLFLCLAALHCNGQSASQSLKDSTEIYLARKEFQKALSFADAWKTRYESVNDTNRSDYAKALSLHGVGKHGAMR